MVPMRVISRTVSILLTFLLGVRPLAPRANFRKGRLPEKKGIGGGDPPALFAQTAPGTDADLAGGAPSSDAASDVDDAERSQGVDGEDSASPFELFVRRTTNRPHYKFGDLTRTTLKAGKSTAETVVRTATGNDSYQFGDLSKSAVEVSKSTAEEVVRKVTGNEEYQFGDITRSAASAAAKTTTNVMTYGEKSLSLMREANVHELVALSEYFWTENLSPEQRREAAIVIINLGAIAVLAYSFLANTNDALVHVAAWTMTSVKLGASPLAAALTASAGAGESGVAAAGASFAERIGATIAALAASPGWEMHLRTKSTLDVLFDGPFLPVRVAILIPFFFTYRRWCVRFERRCGYSIKVAERYPLATRVLTLLIMWVWVNLVGVAAMGVGMAWLASLVTGVPLR